MVHKILILHIWTLTIFMNWSCNLHDILNWSVMIAAENETWWIIRKIWNNTVYIVGLISRCIEKHDKYAS